MIYGRFGYGLASPEHGADRDRCATWRSARRSTSATERWPRPTPRHCWPIGPAIFDRATCRTCPAGWPGPRPWWDYQIHDSDERRKDSGRVRFALHHEPDGTPSGFAIYRPKPDWTATGPNGTLHIEEVRATDPRAYARIWRFLLEMDLVRSIKYDGAAVDEPVALPAGRPACAAMRGRRRHLRPVGRRGPRARAAPRTPPHRHRARCAGRVLPVEHRPLPAAGRPRRRRVRKHRRRQPISRSPRATSVPSIWAVPAGQLAAAGLVDELTPGSALRAAGSLRLARRTRDPRPLLGRTAPVTI